MARGHLACALALLAACDGETAIFGTTQLGDTEDRLGPYVVVTEVSDPDGVDGVNLVFRAGGTDEVSRSMSEVSGGVYEGSIPGQPPFTVVEYYVEARDGDSRVTDPPDALTGSGNRYSFKVLSTRCTGELDCGPGELCDASGRCRQSIGPCTTDLDCGKGMRCGADGACRLAARSCTLDEGCLVGEVCDAILGQCAPRPLCSGGLTCPLDFACETASGLCRRSCMGHADCGPGELCVASTCTGAKACDKTEDCDSGLVCDPVGGYCRPEGASPCAACKLDVDCGGPTDFCLLLQSGQFCGQDCSSAACPAGYGCSKNTTPPQCVPTSGSCS